jgi:beta-phosphoglucomutase
LELYKIELSEEEIQKIMAEKNEMYVSLIQNITKDNILPGVVEFIKKAKGMGYLIGMASVSKNSFTLLKKLGLDKYFDAIAEPSKLSKSKPDPEIFLSVANMFKLKPEECIGIEDAQSGVESIKSAKMQAVCID